MKIVADENIPSVHEFFEKFGEIKTFPGRELTAEQVKNADILLIRSVTKVNQSLLEGSSVKFVGTCTIGVDHLDTDYLDSNNIVYANAPGCNADGVVQYDLAALAALDEQWQTRKIGVVGCGNVGGRLLKALQGLGVECVVYDPFLSPQNNSLLTDFDTVLKCDIVCMHVPYTTTGRFPSHHMLNAATLKKLRPGAILLNAGRGGAIDNQALLHHLKSGADISVILDVWENEPNINVELMSYVKLATSHIAGYGYDGKLNGSAMIFSSLLAFLNKEFNLNKAEYEAYSQKVMAQLKGESESIECESINSAVAATYDIHVDDARFRAALREASLLSGDIAGHIGKAFDNLRKTYPKRREFNHFQVKTSETKLKQLLGKIGFVEAIAYEQNDS